ncbi:MAG: DUF5615 family PIN-like protein [Sporichthyaceae bacterium]
MKLLLDEHLSPRIALLLRERGHDVIAVSERRELRGRPDWVHFAGQADQCRAIATRDLGDFRPLLHAALREGRHTYGLVCVAPRFSLARKDMGKLAAAFDELLTAHPALDAAVAAGGELWLRHPADAVMDRVRAAKRSD